MIRKLLIVFASGLVFAIILLSSAWVIGGQDLITRIDKEGGYTVDLDDDKDSGPQVTRSFEFKGIKTLTMAAPVTLTYVKGDKAEMIVSGSEKLMNRLVWENGKLSLGRGLFVGGGDLTVTITAPQLPDLVVSGASDIDLAGLDQPLLSIDASGATDVTGQGKVERIVVDSSGASEIDLKEVEAKDAEIEISGAGDADIAASGKVDASISGAGTITLHRKPSELTSKVSGAGEITHAY